MPTNIMLLLKFAHIIFFYFLIQRDEVDVVSCMYSNNSAEHNGTHKSILFLFFWTEGDI